MDKKKGTYKGLAVRWWNNKWWVIPKDGGSWKEYGGKFSDIEFEKEEERKERFFKINYSFLENESKDLDAIDKMILISLFSHKKNDSNKIWPSIGRLSFLSGVSKRTISRRLPKLLKKFNIKKERIFGSKNRYYLD